MRNEKLYELKKLKNNRSRMYLKTKPQKEFFVDLQVGKST